MARRLPAFVGLVGIATVVLVGQLAGVGAAASGTEIPVVPVHGRSVGHGVSLYVNVFYAKGGKPGPPGGGGTVNCTDTDQTGYAAPFASASAIALHLTTSTVPSGLSGAYAALSTAASQWHAAGAQVSIDNNGVATRPAKDGDNIIGWARLVPKNVLAATWTWVNETTGRVEQADILFNTTQPWATLYPQCPTTATGNFDVADIATHEMGHVFGLNHFSDTARQATMYPTAPPDEVRKISLTTGDEDALKAARKG